MNYKSCLLSSTATVITTLMMISSPLQASNKIDDDIDVKSIKEKKDNNFPLSKEVKKYDEEGLLHQEFALRPIEKANGLMMKFEKITQSLEDSLQKKSFNLEPDFFFKEIDNEAKKIEVLVNETGEVIEEKFKSILVIKVKSEIKVI